MGNLWQLTKFHLSYYVKPRFESAKARNKFILLGAFIGLCFLMPIAMIISFVYMTTGLAVKVGIEAEFLSLIFFATQVSLLFLGTASYLNIMYFSKDNTLLASMPIKTSHIYLSKLIVCLISMMVLALLIILPSIIASSVALYKAGIVVGASYYIFGLLGVIIVPLLTLLVISLLAFPVMKIVSYLKKKPVLMAVVSTTFAISIMILIWAGMFSLGTPNGNMQLSEQFIQSIASVGKYSYATLLLSKIMLGVDIGVNILILMGILIGSIIINVLLSMLLYRKTILTLGEGGASSSKIKTRESKALSSRLSLLKREFMCVIRCPDLFMQTLMMIIIAPILIVVFTLFQGETDSKMNAGLFVSGMIFFYINIMMGMNYLSTIGISREREKVAILKTLPIKVKDVISAKLLLSDIATIIGCVICSIVYIICAKGVNWYFVFPMLASTLVIGTSMNAYGLYRDAKKPNFKWMNAREIVKNNFGAMIPMLIAMIPGFVVMILAGGLSATNMSYGMQDLIVWLVIGAFSIAYFFMFRFKSVSKIANLFANIEP